MTRHPRLLLHIVLLAFAAAGAAVRVCAQGAEKQEFIYFWEPRAIDVSSSPDASDHVQLKYLVERAAEETYTISPEDKNGLDDIIRKRFLLSQTKFPYAFSIYLANILARNNIDLKTPLITGKTILKLPSGPRYAALEVPQLDLQSYYAAANLVFSLHRTLSVQQLQDSLTRSLAQYTSFAKEFAVLGTRPRAARSALEEILDRKLLPANTENVRRFDVITATENVHFFDTAENIIEVIRPKTAPTFLPAGNVLPIDCDGKCATCEEILGTGVSTHNANVRLLIADTGVSKTYKNVSLVYTATPKDYVDVDPFFHGSFVYSEVANTLKGVLDPKVVEVAKVAVPVNPRMNPTGQRFQWSIDDLKRAIDDFAGRYRKSNPLDPANPKLGPTWVVNVSAGGKPQFGKEVPSVLTSEFILLVASAGNDHSFESPTTNLFPMINSANMNILIVGALDRDNKHIASYSNFNTSRVDVFVRGSCVCGEPNQLSGTSQASPIAAVAALAVAANNPEWSAKKVKWRLISSSDITNEVANCDFDENIGYCGVGGVLNLPRALGNSTSVTYYASTVDGQVQLHTEERVDDFAESELPIDWRIFLSLNSKRQVLRIHKEDCIGANFCFFRVYRLGEEPERMQLIHSPLPIMVGGRKLQIPVADLEDLHLRLQ